MYKVVITGIGIVSCLGPGVEAVTDGLRKGRSGIVVDEERIRLGFRSPLTGKVRGFDPDRVLTLKAENVRSPETGLIFGCDSSCVAMLEQVERLRRYGDTKSIGSGLTFRCITSTITLNLNTILKTLGACWTISSACSSGGHAIGQAADLIALGRQERVICGGAQEINWQSMCSFDGLGAFSLQVDTPEAACRPFDAGRDGLVPSGGAAALILERRDLAEKRGAEILGEVAAYAFSSDGSHISIPSRWGLERAMTGALQRAGMTPGEIDYVCAHATSTPVGDAAEAQGIGSVFGPHRPLVSSLKSMTGHELWMSGASQAVYAAIMARQGFVAPNINFEAPDSDTEGLNIVRETLARPPDTAMCNSAGFGGTNSCLILDFRKGRR
jgi:3-oxoacyl-[acyl-carrier-protein] synthase-1